jgi:hypothetical protein
MFLTRESTRSLPATIPREDSVSYYERRQEPRFALRVPAFIGPSDGDSPEFASVTENLSKTGVALRAASGLPRGARVYVRVLLPSGPQLKGAGTIVRLEQKKPGAHFLIVVACDTPFEPFPPFPLESDPPSLKTQ